VDFVPADAVPGVNQYCEPYTVPTCQFNSAAFVVPAAGVFGSVGRNTLRGPSFVQSDLSIGKNTYFSETLSLNLRVEIFNFLNFANYA
jgi:hypothetical protein